VSPLFAYFACLIGIMTAQLIEDGLRGALPPASASAPALL
jgi:hypothetical protein